MKRIVFVCLLALSLTVSAQEHLTFKGVEINGSLESFTQKLKAKGLTHLMYNGNQTFLKGSFAGYDNCTIIASPNENGNVTKVMASFPAHSSWSTLYQNYSSIRDLLTRKYGEPALNDEIWQGYSVPTDDNSRMYEVRMDRAKFVSAWNTPNGEIDLMIKYVGGDCVVVLVYFDAAGQEAALQSAYDDL